MNVIDELKTKYPGAKAWQMGDSPSMADELADLVVKGIKTATCSSFDSFKTDECSTGYNIILNGQGIPVCVIRMVALHLVRFCDVTEAFVLKEGEGDLSLECWRKAHKAFFLREGFFSEDMELIVEEFELIEIL